MLFLINRSNFFELTVKTLNYIGSIHNLSDKIRKSKECYKIIPVFLLARNSVRIFAAPLFM